MTVTAARTPTTLTWANFSPQPTVVDPRDGTVVDAFTTFDFFMLTSPLIVPAGGRFRVNPALVISLVPLALVADGTSQTAALLAHEQIHYDVGFVIARQLARDLNVIDDATEAGLRKRMTDLTTLHFTTRAGLIQARYDRESNHGLNAHFQNYWSNQMAKCLANAQASEIGGWML